MCNITSGRRALCAADFKSAQAYLGPPSGKGWMGSRLESVDRAPARLPLTANAIESVVGATAIMPRMATQQDRPQPMAAPAWAVLLIVNQPNHNPREEKWEEKCMSCSRV
jgi:hypothetical protein